MRSVSVLQCQRSSVGVFAGKHGLITLRDLFKWAGRYALTEGRDRFNDWEQTLAEDGEGGVHGTRLFGCAGKDSLCERLDGLCACHVSGNGARSVADHIVLPSSDHLQPLRL